MELLFDRLDSMNGACINRFASWFAYHLSNFQFRWGWNDWGVSLKDEPLRPKPKFIAETLQYCLRLSYHSKVLESVPQNFHNITPAQPKPRNRFVKENEDSEELEFTDISGSENAKALMEALRQKCTAEEVIDILNEISDDTLMDIDGGKCW